MCKGCCGQIPDGRATQALSHFAEVGADIMMDPLMNPWDLLPLVPVIRGAGGVITAWDGGDVVKADSCLAASPKIDAQALANIRALYGNDGVFPSSLLTSGRSAEATERFPPVA
jgi:hypothetical protein